MNGYNVYLPKYPFLFYFSSADMAYVPFVTVTYAQAIAELPRDGNPCLKLWMLAPRGSLDDTIARRRAAGCQLASFCQRCVTAAPEDPDEMYCSGCTLTVATEQAQDEVPAWGG